MSNSLIVQIIEWAGLIALVAYVIASTYRDIVEILYDRGIPLPKFIEEALYARKKREITHALEKIGIISQSDQYKQLYQISKISEQRPNSDYTRELEQIIAHNFSRGAFKIGKTYTYEFDYYVDVMGGTTNYIVAERCARILANFIRDEMKKAITEDAKPIIFDKIVVPKLGSPTLGFILGHILGIPCIFFRGDEEPKVRTSSNIEIYFDGEISAGDRVILVDDSTTGGRMFNSAILKIRQANSEIQHGFVLFEPLGKGARERLKYAGLELHSIIKLDKDVIDRLTTLARNSN